MNIKEIPKAIALWSTQGHHAGFMLTSVKEGEFNGDCVFMLSPVSTDIINSEMRIIISELKVGGEHHFNVIKKADSFELVVRPRSLPELKFQLNLDFKGEIFTDFNNEYQCVGTVAPAKKNA